MLSLTIKLKIFQKNYQKLISSLVNKIKKKKFISSKDTTGEAEKSFEVLKKKGKCYTIAGIPDGSVARSSESNSYFFVPVLLDAMTAKIRFLAYMNSIDYQFISLETNSKDLEKISKYISKGLIKPIVDKTFDLENIKDAFEYLEKGRTVGKNCIKIKNEE